MARSEPSNSVVLATTASSVVVSRNCILTGLILSPAAASCTVSLYDPPVNTTTTTNATLRITLAGAAAGGSVSASISDSGIQFLNGCVAVVSGAGAQATVITATI